ncbi:MAG: AAA family ATPase [Polyangiaceae bacterium]|nr:AAA family ATPase [Polyangiaceae bacterium]
MASVRSVPAAELKNAVRAGLEAAAVELENLPEAQVDFDDWYGLLDEPDVDILDERLKMVGKITGYERAGEFIHVMSDKPRKLLRTGTFVVKNFQKERLLRQQEVAIDALTRGDTARADLPHLLAEASVHRMGEKPFVELMQPGLKPEARVRDIVDRILASRTVFCLQGPPGTGKTTIIAEVVAQLLARQPSARILISSQANEAVANAIERVLEVRKALGRDWIVVRDVRPERARVEGPWAGYDAAYREFVTRIQKGTADALAGDARVPGAERAVAEWLESVEHGTRKVTRDYTGLVQVWGATTARSTRPLDAVEPAHYDLVILDEAAKATVGEVLVPIVRAQRLLRVGDEKQLPPFLEETTTQALLELGIAEDEAKYSLFEHLLKLVPREHREMLTMQFRMHPTIGDVVSALFYEKKVGNGPGTENRPLPAGAFDRAHRVMWVDVVGQDVRAGKTSRANDAEIGVICRLLEKLDHDTHAAGMTLKVAVIAAYRGQFEKLDPRMRELQPSLKALKVSAATVDSFQGREADVVLYSLVRTGDAERTFLADGRRFNVALSRARRLLIMVGDRTGARGTARLRDLLAMIPDENQVSAASFVPVRRLGALLDALLNRKGPPEGGDA